ncbi:MAG: hypothetical protein WCX31_05095 [Salinivirgaceae bacterium]|jgi:hypothetical protein
MKTQDEALRNACYNALEFFQKNANPDFADIKAKLEYVIGSYDYDKNPIGLFEIGQIALDSIKELKKNNPRKVAKKLIDDLEKSLAK